MNKIEKAETEYEFNANNREEQFGEELFNLLLRVLNSPANRRSPRQHSRRIRLTLVSAES